MGNYTKIVQEIARGWTRGTTSPIITQQTTVENIIESLYRGTGSKAATIGDTVELTLNSAKKYLDEFCNIFKEGKYTVISHKNGGIVDVSKIGELNRDGTIIRYNTAKQAEEEAKKILMKQFDVPLEQQRELSLITRDKDLFLNTIGDAHEASLPGVDYDLSVPKRELKIFHNHPQIDVFEGKSYPLSVGDLQILASDNLYSVTAINHLGEFSTATLKESLKYPGLTGTHLFRTLKARLEPVVGKGVIPENNPELYSQEVHKAYKELLSQYGIEYTTNYSYLTNL